MHIKQIDRIIYTTLFTGLGIFSYLLLSAYTHIPERLPDDISSGAICLFFIIAFNFLGFSTIQIYAWVNRQYARNINKRWQIMGVYLMVMLMFLLLNYHFYSVFIFFINPNINREFCQIIYSCCSFTLITMFFLY